MKSSIHRVLFAALTYLVLAGLTVSAEASVVVKLTVEGTIHQGTVATLDAAMAMAKERKAEAVLLELDTPGGLLDATRDIVKQFLNSEIPIIVYVAPSGARAGSAGTFITMAAHVAAMAPSTNIGAAHPITIGGKDPEKEGGKHLAKKIENDTLAFIEAIAQNRKRNAKWAKEAVKESSSITAKKAAELNVIDFIAKNETDLLEKAHGRKVKVKAGEITLQTKDATILVFKPDFKTRTKNFLANPTVLFLLIMLAGLGFYIEFSNPGLIFPSVIGGLAVILVLIATSVIPITAVGVGLIALGFVLLFMEIYVTSYGLLAMGGVIAFVIGASLLFDPAEIDLKVPKGLITGVAVAFGGVGLMIAIGISKILKAKQTAGQEGFVGEIGEADETLEPGKVGRIFINGEYWQAVAEEKIEKGEKVEVVSVKGLEASVKRAPTMVKTGE